MRQWQVWLAAAAALAVVGFSIWGVGLVNPNKPKPVGMKRLSGTVLEKFVYRSGKERHPRATCNACRFGKVKMGVISIGPLNVLEFDDLVVNVPPSAKKDVQALVGNGTQAPVQPALPVSEAMPSGSAASDMVDSFDLKPLMIVARSDFNKPFAVVRINRFTLNRMVGDELELVFSAELLKSKGRSIMLYGVTIKRSQEEEKLASAELVLKPTPKIVWQGGALELPKRM